MNIEKIKWAILVTGWGRNAKDTIEAYTKGKLKKSDIVLVIYEDEPCGAADLAKEVGIDAVQIIKKDYPNRIAYQHALINILQNKNIDYVFLLNYKYIIKNDMLSAFPNRIINIHPSLFPSFLATKTAVQEALAYGVKITGITTHVIDDKIDEGRILCQKAIKVKNETTFEEIYPKFAKAGKKLIRRTIKVIEKNHFNGKRNIE